LLRGDGVGDLCNESCLLDAHLLQGIGALAQALLLFRDAGLNAREPLVAFGLNATQLLFDQLDAGVPFARLGSVALGAPIAAEHLVADARPGLGQIASQHLDLRGVFRLDARASLLLGLQ
jgi:hypothetical protein